MNFFFGKNGEGKTNLLEGIGFILRGDSFRDGKRSHSIQFSKDVAIVGGEVEKSSLNYKLDLKIYSEKRDLLVNGKKTPLLFLKQNFNFLEFTPQSLKVVQASSERKRFFLDKAVLFLFPEASEDHKNLTKAYKSKNLLLKEYKRGAYDKVKTKELLEALSPSYFKFSARWLSWRQKFLEEMASEFKRFSKEFIPSRDSEIFYNCPYGNIGDAITLEKRLAEQGVKRQNDEIFSGVNLVGPQNDEITFLTGGKEGRFYASQGQQRALILAFKISQIITYKKRHKYSPILLLDDVFSELDFLRKEELLDAVKNMKCQAFITMTERDSMTPQKMNKKASNYHVKNGTILRE